MRSFPESIFKAISLPWVGAEECSPIGQAEVFRLENEKKMQVVGSQKPTKPETSTLSGGIQKDISRNNNSLELG